MNNTNQELLAALFDEMDGDDEIIARAKEGEEVPLSYAQQQLWFLQSLEPGLTAYNLPRVFRLKGVLSADALERAFQAVIERHAVLRSRFFERKGEPVQIVLRSVPFSLERIDLLKLPSAVREATLADVIERTVFHVFDLDSAPVLVAVLIKLAEDEHVLAACMHHITSDAWSNPILARDLVAAYGLALQEAGPVYLPQLPVQYVDYAIWQRERVESGDLARDLDYWNDYLGSDVPILELPIDHVRPERQTFAGKTTCFELEPALAEAVQTFCRVEKCTPFVVLLVAWQVLLARYSGQSDFAIGVPNAGRHHEELQELLGFFITTQVFRVRLAPQMTLRQICRQVRTDALAALDHADLPFEVLLQSRKDQRDPARSPLFQVMFGVQVAESADTLALEGVVAESVEFAEEGAKFELSLDFMIERNRVQGRLEYNTDLFAHDTAKRLIENYIRVLEIVTADPDCLLANVDFLSKFEQRQLRQWGVNDKRYPTAGPVHRLIEQQVAQRSDGTALIFDDIELSYAELNQRANQLAHRLITLGVKPEVKVGIAVERSIEMVVGLLAIMKAGGVYVPLDPEYPAERLAYIAEDSGIRFLLTQSDIKTGLPQINGLNTLELDTLDLGSEPEHNPEVSLHEDSLAYVIYTSGSTGKPKGVAIRHYSLASCMMWMQQTYGLTQADTVLHKAPFGFDVSVWEIFWPLTVGVRLVVANPGDQRDPARIVELIRQHQITTLNFVPSMLQAFLAYEGIEAQTRLKYVICGGEAMPEATQREALQRLQGVSLQNLYGPTETTIHVTRWTCRDDGQIQVPIGRPISSTGTYVLDTNLNRVPQGVTGELYIGGGLLARGYLNRASLSAERFVADPFDEEGGRLYRTGDLVRWRSDGQLEYLGRIDHQVKIRGFRIELGEIEAWLLARKDVREAVVVAQESTNGQRLVAYVSGHVDEALDATEMKVALGGALPDYMVPSAIVVLESLPLNANDKVDRKALPDAKFENTGHYEAPQGEVEEALAVIWAEVLGIERVGRNDNFFELGGHSLMALRVVRMMDKLRPSGASIGLRDLFSHSTIARLTTRSRSLKTVKLNTSLSAEAPLFFIHDGRGSILDCMKLAKSLAHTCSVIGIPYSHSTQAAERPQNLLDLAQMHVAAIRETQRSGPYRICGWSLGGAIAPLVAGILEHDVEDVQFVGVIDPYVHNPERVVTVNLVDALKAFFSTLIPESMQGRLIQNDTILTKLNATTEQAQSIKALIDLVLSMINRRHLHEYSLLTPQELADMFITTRFLDRIAMSQYTPAALQAPVTVWWSNERYDEEKERFWLQLGRKARHDYWIDADHLGIIRAPEIVSGLREQLMPYARTSA